MIDMSLIVIDTSTAEFQGNRIFNAEYASRFPGASSTAKLYQIATNDGHDVITSDIYAKMKTKPSKALCISDRVTPFVSRQLRNGQLAGAVLCNFESPNVDISFYHSIHWRSSLFKHVFLYRGVKDKVAKGAVFHNAYFPQSRNMVICGFAWNRRDFLVMIVSNKQAAGTLCVSKEIRNPITKIRSCINCLRCKWYKLVDPILRVKDLYNARLDAISYFANVPGFSLFGTGWDQRRGLGNTQWQIIKRLRPTSVADKLDALGRFRYALCFENCVFPGYVTEKIFDCFLAGCIPVYLGAPDITDFVPKGSFIDFREFGNYVELERFLREMSEMDFQKYLDTAREFLASTEFNKYTSDYYVNEILSVIEQEFAQQ